MENTLLVIVILLLLIVILMGVGVFILGWKLFHKKETEKPTLPLRELDRFHPAARARIEEAMSSNDPTSSCVNHPKEPAEAPCAICDQYFCKACIKTHQNLIFCRPHLAVFNNNQWGEVVSLKSSPSNPEAGVELIEWKKKQWDKEQMPLYVETHYKIKVDSDEIESWIVLFARESDKESARRSLGLSD